MSSTFSNRSNMDYKNRGGGGGQYEQNGYSKPFNRNMPNKVDDERKLFVGGLTWETTKEDLIAYFSKYGQIEDASIKIDFNTGRSRGFGFILFDTKDAVEQILSSKDHVINGRSIDPKPAKHKSNATPIRKVFVGGLDPSYPEADLRKYFSKFGKIEEIEFPFDKLKNQRKSFCFILFETDEAVNECLVKSKHLLGSKEVDVKRALPPKDQNQMMNPQMGGFMQQNAWNPGGYEQYQPVDVPAGYADPMLYYGNGNAAPAVDSNYYADPAAAAVQGGGYGGYYADPNVQAPAPGGYGGYPADSGLIPGAYDAADPYGGYNAATSASAGGVGGGSGLPGGYDQSGYYQGQNGSGKLPGKRSHSYHPYQR